MQLLSVTKSPKPDKKLRAKLKDCETDRIKHIDFGSKGSSTYAQGASKQKQVAYIKRHKVNEDWTKVNPGSLSMYILWSAKSIPQGIKNFKKHFHC